jgi:hypothetical protein
MCFYGWTYVWKDAVHFASCTNSPIVTARNGRGDDHNKVYHGWEHLNHTRATLSEWKK